MTESSETLDERQLAERAGVGVDTIRQYTTLGFLDPTDSTYTDADVARVRLVSSCERGGLPLEGMAEAVERGLVSFSFLDQAQYRRFGSFSDRTYGRAAAEAGVSFEFVRRIYGGLGLSIPSAADDRIRESDLLLVRMIGITAAFGVPEEAVERAVRVYGDGLRRITEVESQIYRDRLEQPLLESGVPLAQAMEAASAFGEEWNAAGDASLLAMYHRHQESVWLGGMVARIEETLEQLGVHQRLVRPPAMVFLDLTGYTQLTEERGDDAAAELAANLADIAQATSQRSGGRPVKWLGDGIMFHFPDPREVVPAALEMVERTPEAGLPPAHVGVAAGPVVMQDGDYFGRTVNLAARISGEAGSSEVLVTTEIVEVTPDAHDLRFEGIGKVELKGFAAPILLHRASRA